MKQEMHYSERENSCRDIVEHDSGAFWKSLQLPHRRRLDDIERSKKYKAQQQRLPCDRRCNQSDKLAGDFVDHHKLRIFATAGPRHLCGRWNSNQNCRKR